MNFTLSHYCQRSIWLILLLTSLNIKAQQPTLNIPFGHQDQIKCMDISADGKFLLTGSSDNTVIIWDLASHFAIRRIWVNEPIQQALFLDNGERILTLAGVANAKIVSSKKLKLCIWETKSGKLLQSPGVTASPAIQKIPGSSLLLVPDYSTDTAEQASVYANAMEFLFSDKQEADSLQPSYELDMDDLINQLIDKDLSDPKIFAEYQKASLEKLTRQLIQDPSLNMLNYKYTLVDSRTLLPVHQFNPYFTPETVVLYYQENAYLLSPSMMYAIDRKNQILLYSIQELIRNKQSKELPKPYRVFKTKTNLTHIIASPTGGFFATAANKQVGIQLWQIDHPEPLATLTEPNRYASELLFSADGSQLFISRFTQIEDFTSTVQFEWWDTHHLKKIASVERKNFYPYQFMFNGAKKELLAVQGNELIHYNQGMDSLGKFTGKALQASYFGFCPDGQSILINYGSTPDLSSALKAGIESLVDKKAEQQNKSLSQAERNRLIGEESKKFHLPTGKPDGIDFIWSLTRGGATIQPVARSGKEYPQQSADQQWTLQNRTFENAQREEFLGSDQIINQLKATTDSNLIIYEKVFAPGTELGKTLRKQRINGPVTQLIKQGGKDTISLINIDSTEWIMLLSSGYYMASRNAAKALTYVNGTDLFSFEQFDIQYNRPDLVLAALGMADPLLIEAYRNAYQKRMKKLGIDTSQFSNRFEVPEADFANRAEISSEQQQERLTLQLIGSDQHYPLDRYNVWVNEVPLYGRDGVSLKAANTKTLNTRVELTLSQGTNQIEISVLNSKGVESFRHPLQVYYRPKKTKMEQLYFIGLGINEFADSTYNLNYCVKDIRDLAARFQKQYGSQMKTKLLLNKNLTLEQVKALRNFLLETDVNDKVIIAYSGHGLLNSRYDYLLSTYAVDFDKPDMAGLPYEELEKLLDSIPARRKLLLLDACHSGELDKDALQQIAQQSQRLGQSSVNIISKGIKIPAGSNNAQKLGVQNSFELMQELFVNLSRETGTTIISAAAGTQFALERGDLQNGVFTYSLLELLQPGKTVTVSALQRHVSKRVPELTGGIQRAGARNELKSLDWQIW